MGVYFDPWGPATKISMGKEHIYICICIYLPTYLSIYLSIYQSINQSIYLPIYLTYIYIYMYMYAYVYIYIYITYQFLRDPVFRCFQESSQEAKLTAQHIKCLFRRNSEKTSHCHVALLVWGFVVDHCGAWIPAVGLSLTSFFRNLWNHLDNNFLFWMIHPWVSPASPSVNEMYQEPVGKSTPSPGTGLTVRIPGEFGTLIIPKQELEYHQPTLSTII